MPDASGNFKGISVPELPWQREDRSELDGSAVREQAARENLQSAKRNIELRTWDEACRAAHINSALRQAEQG